ncbi:MAG: acetyltransferase, CysE/LacA/LpxA/NodL family [candidate division WS6 bacterium 34_10]|jgi:acetyltransferase-like isoleucine patch superfamily enzyme|uniref:Acetyltransferase, CysE/LacA/LpxA/NodL family n=1 Tax=candidate division WS6 bacterium 34_10 TaxID=1641389 RepID=A0A101HJ44_9BACT|nr:MAG: acetyltransferase, CysE/LacA/LpxA/NodL family [candidate division WS6 bacterium 34_10]
MKLNKTVLSNIIASKFGLFYANQWHKKHDIGDYTYGNPKILYSKGASLEIGKYCSIARKVKIFLGGNHRIDWVTTYPFPERVIKNEQVSKGDVKIGNDVWIGRGATILSGVTIGDGAVIGAYSVVAKDVEPYSIVVGNPARHIKYRFDKETVDKLLDIEWWNWDHKKVLDNIGLLCSSGIEKFVERHWDK